MTEQHLPQLAPELTAAVAETAAFRGMTAAQYIEEVVSIATGLDAKLASDLKEADDDFAAGRWYTQEQVEAMFAVRREQRDAA